MEALQEKLKNKKAQLQQLQDSDESQLSLTDPDARQLSKRGQSIAGYNVQIAVDEKHKLLAASDVPTTGTTPNSFTQLAVRQNRYFKPMP